MEGYLISWLIYDVWLLYLFLYTKTHSFHFLRSKRVGFGIFFILFLIIVFGEHSGDFRHYEEIIDKFSMSDEVASNFEPFYIWLTKVTGYNITLFRSVIGFFMMIAVYQCCKIYKELSIPSIFLFTLIPFYFLSNAIRQGVANSICLWGLFLLFYNRKTLFAIILIGISFFLHKSSFLIIPALLFLYVPITKKNVILFSIALIPIIFIENIILVYITDILLGDGVIAFYMTITSEDTTTFLMKVMDFLFIAIILILAYLSIKRVYRYGNPNKKRPLMLVTRLLFGCCYMYLIYDGLQLDANYVAGRFAPFMYIPLVIVMMKAYGIRILKNQTILSLLIMYFILINLQIYRWFLVFF